MGRKMTTFASLAFLTTIVICCFLMNPPPESSDWGPLADGVGMVFPITFGVLFIGLSVTVYILIKKLSEKNELLSSGLDNSSENFFKKEIKILTIIIVAFSIGYLMRVLTDITIGFT